MSPKQSDQSNAASAWRLAHRPHWLRHNPLNKLWFVEIQARQRRDAQLVLLCSWANAKYLDNEQHAALRQLARLKADDAIDALCMPAWAAKAFAWPWNPKAEAER
jgi:hypothetical protein